MRPATNDGVDTMSAMFSKAADMLSNPRTQGAFRLDDEPDAVRDRVWPRPPRAMLFAGPAIDRIRSPIRHGRRPRTGNEAHARGLQHELGSSRLHLYDRIVRHQAYRRRRRRPLRHRHLVDDGKHRPGDCRLGQRSRPPRAARRNAGVFRKYLSFSSIE